MKQPSGLSPTEAYDLQEHLREIKRAKEEAISNIAKSAKLSSFIEDLLKRPPPTPPAWIHSPKSGSKQATPTAFLSDAHFDEVVHPEQVEWLNGYNRKIAEQRIKQFFQSTVVLSKDYLKGVEYPGIVMPMGGDMFSGDIHEELKETNEATIQESIYFWLDPMIAGIRLMADEFGKVHIPLVVGNHPRGTKKPSHKMRVPNNFDWLFGVLLEKFLANDKRITFDISTSADVSFKIYNTRFRLSHGDQFRGGSGIAGALSPLMIGDARKRKRSQAAGNDYDYLVLAHWHQLMYFKGLIVNGSLKGYDEYSYLSNFGFEPPQQAFWLTTEKHGITIHAPLHVIGKNEPWMKK